MGETPLFKTFEEAHRFGAFNLAARWARRVSFESDVEAEIDELATMAALMKWLDGWLAIHIHRALLEGAPIGDVAAAVGLEISEVVRRWQEWSDGQRHLQTAMPDLRDHSAEFDQVAELIRRSVPDKTPVPSFDVRALYAALDVERRRRGLYWQGVAEQTGVAKSFFTRLGQGKDPAVHTLVRVLRWLGTSDLTAFITEPDNGGKEAVDTQTYLTGVMDQLRRAVADGDGEAAEKIVDLVDADGYPGAAAALGKGLEQTSVADQLTD